MALIPAHPLKSASALSRFLLHLLNFTIARKITVIVAVSVLVSVLSATGFYVYRQTDQNIAARHDSVTATAQVFAASVGPHLHARNKSAVLGSLRAIGNLKSIPFISAKLADGKVFATLGNAVIVEQGTGLGTISASPRLPRHPGHGLEPNLVRVGAGHHGGRAGWFGIIVGRYFRSAQAVLRRDHCVPDCRTYRLSAGVGCFIPIEAVGNCTYGQPDECHFKGPR